jgi:Tfp pilus assembly protein PilE
MNTSDQQQKMPVKSMTVVVIVVLLAFAYFEYSNYYSTKVTNTQEAIISRFQSNIDAFNGVAEYILKNPETDYFDKQSKLYHINGLETKNQLKKIMTNLGYSAITEADASIYFIKTSADTEKGVVYINSTDSDRSGVKSLIPVSGQWYYYEK